MLELHYMPPLVRLPFRRMLYERGVAVQACLGLVRALDAEYRRIAERYRAAEGAAPVLPFLLSAVLAKTSSRSDFYEVLFELRTRAEPLRRRRAELETALLTGDVVTIRKLRAAMEQESRSFSATLPTKPIAAGVAAVLPALAANLPLEMLVGIGVLTFASQFPKERYQRVAQRVFRPQLWCLTDISKAATSMTDALPRISTLWVDGPRAAATFPARMKQLSALVYA